MTVNVQIVLFDGFDLLDRLNPECAGIILVPGASGDVEGEGDNSVLLGRALNTELTGLVGQALGRQDIVIATVCGGSLLLAMGGLLEGRPAVTHHLGMTALGVTGAIPVAARVVDDGNLVTSGGVTSGLDLALHLVERELGPRIAHAVLSLLKRTAHTVPTVRIPPRSRGLGIRLSRRQSGICRPGSSSRQRMARSRVTRLKGTRRYRL
nr:DJ-1/PfpI family protein [Paenibacillus oceani]